MFRGPRILLSFLRYSPGSSMSYSLEPNAMRELVSVAQIMINPADPCGVGDAEVFSDPRNTREILSPMTHSVQRRYLLNDEQIVDADDTAAIGVATGDRRRLAVLRVVLPRDFLPMISAWITAVARLRQV